DDGIFLAQAEKVEALIEMSDHCVASNELIAEYVRARHSRVTVIPTAVPLDRYTPRATEQPRSGGSSRPVIGWIGTLPNLPFLAVCAPALRRLAERYDYELLVVAPTAAPLAQVDMSGVQVNF